MICFPHRSTRSTPAVLLSLSLFGLLLAGPSLADDMGLFAQRKLRGQATTAFEAGDMAEAANLFSRLADASKNNRRAQSLYFVALAKIQDPAVDPVEAHDILKTLIAEFPDHDLVPSARALNQLVEQITGVRQQVSTAMAKAAERAEQAEQLGASHEATADQAASLASEVERLVAELRATRAELAKKEEALQKLKQVVMDGDG